MFLFKTMCLCENVFVLHRDGCMIAAEADLSADVETDMDRDGLVQSK